MDRAELIERLNNMADSLCPVAGTLMSLACRQEQEHKQGCVCEICRAFLATQECQNEMEEIIRRLRNE